MSSASLHQHHHQDQQEQQMVQLNSPPLQPLGEKETTRMSSSCNDEKNSGLDEVHHVSSLSAQDELGERFCCSKDDDVHESFLQGDKELGRDDENDDHDKESSLHSNNDEKYEHPNNQAEETSASPLHDDDQEEEEEKKRLLHFALAVAAILIVLRNVLVAIPFIDERILSLVVMITTLFALICWFLFAGFCQNDGTNHHRRDEVILPNEEESQVQPSSSVATPPPPPPLSSTIV